MWSSSVTAPQFRAVIFDLDGTLVDTRACAYHALAQAVREVFAVSAASPPIDLSLPLEAMLRGSMPGRTEAEYDRLAAAFRHAYDSVSWPLAVAYPGAHDCLARLHASDLRLYVVTNKRESAARKILGLLGLAEHVDAVLGQPETGAPIPKAELAGRCLTDAGLGAADAVAVGDSDQDASMADAMQMAFVAVTGGAGPLTPGRGSNRRDVDELRTVPDLLLGVAGGRMA